jgi:hypothetical protein
MDTQPIGNAAVYVLGGEAVKPGQPAGPAIPKQPQSTRVPCLYRRQCLDGRIVYAQCVPLWYLWLYRQGAVVLTVASRLLVRCYLCFVPLDSRMVILQIRLLLIHQWLKSDLQRRALPGAASRRLMPIAHPYKETIGGATPPRTTLTAPRYANDR